MIPAIWVRRSGCMSEAIEQSSVQGKRARPRDSVLLMGTVRLAGEHGEPLPIRVRNLSSTGLMAECQGRLEAGAAVEIALRNLGAIEGKVMWAREGRIGVHFSEAIDPRQARQQVAARPPEPKPPAATIGIFRRPGLKID